MGRREYYLFYFYFILPPNTIGNTIFKIVLPAYFDYITGLFVLNNFISIKFDSITICTGNTIGNTIRK